MKAAFIVLAAAVVAASGALAYVGGHAGARSVRSPMRRSEALTRLEGEMARLHNRVGSLEAQMTALREDMEEIRAATEKIGAAHPTTTAKAAETPERQPADIPPETIKEVVRGVLKEMKKPGKRGLGGPTDEEDFAARLKKEKARALKRLAKARETMAAGGDEKFQEAADELGLDESQRRSVRQIILEWLTWTMKEVEALDENMTREELDAKSKELSGRLKEMLEQVLSPEQLEMLKKKFPDGPAREFVR